jgi:hypothetical protein
MNELERRQRERIRRLVDRTLHTESITKRDLVILHRVLINMWFSPSNATLLGIIVLGLLGIQLMPPLGVIENEVWKLGAKLVFVLLLGSLGAFFWQVCCAPVPFEKLLPGALISWMLKELSPFARAEWKRQILKSQSIGKPLAYSDILNFKVDLLCKFEKYLALERRDKALNEQANAIGMMSSASSEEKSL